MGSQSQRARTPEASFPLLYRSSRPGPNMLDGLKMEENFQSAIETSASFSSLLGECSGSAPRAHFFHQTPSSATQLARTRSAIREPGPVSGSQLSRRSVCPSVPLGPSYPKPTSRPRPHARGTKFPKAVRGGRDCSWASEWQVIKNTQGWIFNHGADRHLVNASRFSAA